MRSCHIIFIPTKGAESNLGFVVHFSTDKQGLVLALWVILDFAERLRGDVLRFAEGGECAIRAPRVCFRALVALVPYEPRDLPSQRRSRVKDGAEKCEDK